jgi:hypothetical protein
MVDQIRRNAPATQTKDTGPTSRLLSSSRTHPTDKQDELIITLAERYENRRARQVGEWERLYGQNVYRAF